MFRHGGTCRARRRCPIHALACVRYASSIAQGVPRAKGVPAARDGVGCQTWSRRVCASTTGHWGSGNAALTLSRRRCRAVPYTSSDTPRFPTMRLSPRPFGSRSGGRLGVICPELRPPLVAIPSVRDTAHPFSAHGFPPLCFHPITYWVSVSIRMTTFQSRTQGLSPFPSAFGFRSVLPRLIPWLISRNFFTRFSSCYAHDRQTVGYYGDSATLQVS